MWDKITSYFRKREAREFSQHATGWHRACVSINDACSDALNDDAQEHADIGVMLDKADKMLFGVRDHLAALRPALKRRDRALEKRVKQASDLLYEVRNKTASFLIRAQGHTPHYMRSGEMPDDAQQAYYLRAMQEVGFEARQAALALRKELEGIWTVMHVMVTEAKEIARE